MNKAACIKTGAVNADHPRCSRRPGPPEVTRSPYLARRGALAAGLSAALFAAAPAPALADAPGNLPGFKKELKKRPRKIPAEKYSEFPGVEGLRVYDISEGAGDAVQEGQRIVVHYDLKFNSVTIASSRIGAGVAGGEPYGMDVGQFGRPGGCFLKGMDLGVRGMRVGGQRSLLVSPELGFGSKQVGEVPPNSTLTLDLELLTIKKSAQGYRVKIVEG
ncbi:unnamed protein product [Pedinophyceae sp. YPF-701]|nr:unnamed protein product [Pedinophyceae sp. YPF-701]